MKVLFSLVLTCLVFVYCDGPKSITANPDKHTTTSGTLGSGKMTNSLPQQPDTARVKKDSLPNRQ